MLLEDELHQQCRGCQACYGSRALKKQCKGCHKSLSLAGPYCPHCGRLDGPKPVTGKKGKRKPPKGTLPGGVADLGNFNGIAMSGTAFGPAIGSFSGDQAAVSKRPKAKRSGYARPEWLAFHQSHDRSM